MAPDLLCWAAMKTALRHILSLLLLISSVARADPPLIATKQPARLLQLRWSGAALVTLGIAASFVGTTIYVRSWIPEGTGIDCDERCPSQPLRTGGLWLAAVGGPLVGAGVALLAVSWN